MEFSAGLTAASQALSIARSIQAADKALDAATLKSKLAEIISELADIKISHAELIEELQSLRKENERLLSAESEIGELQEQAGYHYRKEGNGLIGWPACPSCLSNDKRIVFLVQNVGYDKAKCPACKTEFSPVTSYLRPGYSRADKHREDVAEQKRRQEAVMHRLNRGF